MKTFAIACIAAIVVALLGVLILDGIQERSDKAFTAPSSVRLST